MHDHDHRHSLSPPLYAQTFVPRCQTVILLIETTIPMVLLRVIYTLFGCLASLKIIPLVSPGILSTFYLIDSYHALKLSLNVPPQSD